MAALLDGRAQDQYFDTGGTGVGQTGQLRFGVSERARIAARAPGLNQAPCDIDALLGLLGRLGRIELDAVQPLHRLLDRSWQQLRFDHFIPRGDARRLGGRRGACQRTQPNQKRPADPCRALR